MRFEEIEKKLSPVHRILLTTDGSVTRVLEALFGQVEVETELQKVIKAGERVASLLEIHKGNKVNLRVVILRAGEINTAYAVSLTPVERIEPEFRGYIMKEDIPIGRIMRKLKIESRRELRNYSVVKAGKKLSRIFRISPGEAVLRRNYNIIREGKIMMNITEFFPCSLYRFNKK
ncbi:MAG TPA: DUF98 domain-containing protein [Euryarchaeota archaeon]|nr:chorismate pyruvate-lyase [archaeon BMS3Bbin15]HDL14795.1 DUF98 domain-containing protein [Euryarchaeota archaeon]